MNSYLPEDQLFVGQWGLKNTGLFPGSRRMGLVGADINVIPVWSQLTLGSKNIKIAIIDSGIDYNHEDLKGNIWVNKKEFYGIADFDDDGNGYDDDIHGYNFLDEKGDPMDDTGHGTRCAGIIGAMHNNIGIAGVMAHVQIVAIKVSNKDHNSALESDIIKAIDYAIKLQVDIISASYGNTDYSEEEKAAIQRANNAGIVFVTSAGNRPGMNNDRPDISKDYPSSYQVDNIIAVAAHDRYGKLSSFSTYGPQSIHVTAPGSLIYTTNLGNKYSRMSSGTSYAAPFVVGVIGLLFSYTGKITPLEVKKRLIRTSAQTSPRLVGKTVSNGHVDAYRFFKNWR